MARGGGVNGKRVGPVSYLAERDGPGINAPVVQNTITGGDGLTIKFDIIGFRYTFIIFAFPIYNI